VIAQAARDIYRALVWVWNGLTKDLWPFCGPPTVDRHSACLAHVKELEELSARWDDDLRGYLPKPNPTTGLYACGNDTAIMADRLARAMGARSTDEVRIMRVGDPNPVMVLELPPACTRPWCSNHDSNGRCVRVDGKLLPEICKRRGCTHPNNCTGGCHIRMQGAVLGCGLSPLHPPRRRPPERAPDPDPQRKC
jgi:hypothetical protein